MLTLCKRLLALFRSGRLEGELHAEIEAHLAMQEAEFQQRAWTPRLPGEPRTVRQRLDESIFEERMLATLSGFFGGLALLLAAIGLYGVVAYGAAQRAREIGVRIALGAERGDVLRLVLRDAMLLVAAGLAIGLAVSLGAARAVASILFGIQPADPLAFVSTACVLFAVGAAAAFLPARRAASMDPMRALREE
jgi:ABC-type antimicrobial peptide transport system permease subunit